MLHFLKFCKLLKIWGKGQTFEDVLTSDQLKKKKIQLIFFPTVKAENNVTYSLYLKN